MNRLRAIAAALVLALAVGSCDSDRRAISRDDLPEVPSEPDYVVVLDDNGFDVDALEVLTTELVEFRVEGSDSRGIHTEDHGIDTGLLLPGESTFVMFDEESRYLVSDAGDDEHTLVIDATAPDGPTAG